MLIPALLQFIKLHVIVVFLNHFVNIPLSFILGFGKYAAFVIALIMDVVQIVVYYNVLNKTSVGKRFGWIVDDKMIKEYHEPEFIARLQKKGWHYGAVMTLSMLPVYFGGIFIAVFTAHMLKLDKQKSAIYVFIGSLIGCFIWTIGIWSMVELAIAFFRR